MSEFEVDDVVRVRSDSAPHAGETGVVVRVYPLYKYSLAIEFDLGDDYEVLQYAPAEVTLVRACLTAGRTVTVVV